MKIIYTDGACSGNPGPGGWAALVFNADKLLKVLGGYAAETTNNQMELSAAIHGLRQLRKGELATIYTDSQYLRLGMTEWLAQWKQKNWRTANKKPVKNRELWETLDRLTNSRIEWHYIKAHNDNIYNEICDQLARKMIEMRGTLSDLKAEFEKLFWQLQPRRNSIGL